MPDEMVIFTRTYDLVTWLLPLAEKFPRSQRFVVTQRLQTAALNFQETDRIPKDLGGMLSTSISAFAYPKLVEAHQRGVEVYCILGDMGSTRKSIDFVSDDGIRFLGCGLHSNDPEDNVLVFTHSLENHQLTYGYHNLDSLLMIQHEAGGK